MATGCHSLPEGKKKWGWCGFGEVLHFLLLLFITVKQVPPAAAPPSQAPLGVSVGRPFAQVISGSSIPANSDLHSGAQGLCASSISSPLPMVEVQHARTNQGTVAKTYMEDVVVLPSKRNGTNRGDAGGNERKGTKWGGTGGGCSPFPFVEFTKIQKG